jgi:hypothetical protein
VDGVVAVQLERIATGAQDRTSGVDYQNKMVMHQIGALIMILLSFI